MKRSAVPILAITIVSMLQLTACGGPQPPDGGDVGRVAPPTTDAGPAEEVAEGCSIPEGMTPIAPVISMPQVAAPDSVKYELETAMLELNADGKIEVKFEFDARNKGDEAVDFAVGFAWRVQETGPGGGPEFSRVSIQLAEARMASCVIEGPEEVQQPYRDAVVYSKTSLEAGASITVKGSYVTSVPQLDKPTTLFGYPDRFGNNWKNYDWPYTKAEAYEELGPQLRPFQGRFVPGKANRCQITLRSKSGENWIRTMSHQQNVEKLRMRGASRWEFYGSQKPAQVHFEYLPGVDLNAEIKTFRGIVRERRDDLRARIRLADLAGRAGDAEAEAEILESLLTRWKNKRAKEQMLTGRNDVRGAAYVALVRALKATDRERDAKQRAVEGIEVIDGLEDGVKDNETNRLIRDWLDLER